MIDSTSTLSQLDLFNQNPVKNVSITEPAPKPVVKPKDPDYLFKIVSRFELMPDGSRRHYDGTGRLCLHSHVPEPKKTAQLKPQPESRQEIGHLTCTGRAKV